MELTIAINNTHRLEGAGYVTNVTPTLHPDRIMEVHDFLYIIDGTWEIYENEIPYNLKNDDLLLLTAGEHHYGRLPSSAGNRHMYIHIYAEKNNNADSTITLKPLYHCGKNPKIKQYFKEIISTYWSDASAKDLKLSLLFALLLCELNSLETIEEVDDKHFTTITSVLSLLQTNPQKLYSCQEMADIFFICPRTLSNIFVKAYGVSFYNYQMNMKLEMVRKYLSDHPDELLYNVAKNFGFYDEFHLSKTYKKKYGYPPKRDILHKP